MVLESTDLRNQFKLDKQNKAESQKRQEEIDAKFEASLTPLEQSVRKEGATVIAKTPKATKKITVTNEDTGKTETRVLTNYNGIVGNEKQLVDAIKNNDTESEYYAPAQSLYSGIKMYEVPGKKNANGDPIYTNDPFQAGAGVAFNEKTGKIEVTVPDSIANTRTYKNSYGDNSALSMLASALAKDTNVTYTDPATGDKVSGDEYLDRWSKGLQELVIKDQQADIYKKGLKDLSARSDIKLYDDELVDAMDLDNVAKIQNQPTDMKHSDAYITFSPKWVKSNANNNALARELFKSDKWNQETGEIRTSDIHDIYNLNKLTSDDLVSALGQIRTKLAMGWVREDTSPGVGIDVNGNQIMVQAPDQDYIDDYASSIAQLNFMLNNDPDGTLWQHLGLDAQAAGEGLMVGIMQASYGLQSFFEGMGSAGAVGGAALTVLGAIATGGTSLAIKGTTIGGVVNATALGGYAGALGTEMVSGKDALTLYKETMDAHNWYNEKLGTVSDTAQGINTIVEGISWMVTSAALENAFMAGGVQALRGVAGAVVGGVAGYGGAGVVESARAAKTTLGAFDDMVRGAKIAETSEKTAERFGKLASKYAKGKNVAHDAKLVAEATEAATEAKLAAKMASDSTRKAMKVIMDTMGNKELAQMVSGAAKFAASKAAGASKVADELVDVIFDTVTSDPETVRRIMAGDVSDDEGYNYLMQQLAANAGLNVGLKAAFRGVRRVNDFFHQTTPGRLINTKVSQAINGLAAKTGNKVDDIKKFFNKGEDVVDSLYRKAEELDNAGTKKAADKAYELRRKAQLLNERRLLRSKRADFSEMKLTADGDISLTAAELAQNDLRKMENAIDNLANGRSYKITEILSDKVNPLIAAQNSNIISLRNKIVKLENLPDSGIVKAGRQVDKTTTILAQQSTNYIQDGYTIMYSIPRDIVAGEAADATQEAINKAAAAKKFLPQVQARYDEAKKVLSPELQNTLDELRDAYMAYNKQFGNYRKSTGTFNVSERVSFDMNPDHYIPSERVMPDSDYNVTRKDNIVANRTVSDIEKQVYGELTDWVDPEIVRFQKLNEAASIEIANDFAKTMESIPGAYRKVQISGEETAREYAMQQGKKQAQAAAKDYTRGIGESIDFKIFTTDSAKAPRASSSQISKKKFAEVQEGVANGLDLANSRTVLSDMGVWNGSLIGQVDDAMTYNSGQAAEDIFDSWMDSLDAESQQYLRSCMLNTVGEVNYSALKDTQKIMGDGLEENLNRIYLRNSKEFIESPTARAIATQQVKGEKAFIDMTSSKNAKKGLEGLNNKIDVDKTVTDFQTSISDGIDNTVQGMRHESQFQGLIDGLAENSPTAARRDIEDYIIYSELRRNKDLAYQAIDKSIDVESAGKHLDADEIKNLKKQAHDMYDANLDLRYGKVRGSLADAGSSIVDRAEWFDEINDLSAKIEGVSKEAKKARSNSIAMLDEQGNIQYVEVDPAFADLYKNSLKVTEQDISIAAQVNYTLNKLFRFNTTSANLGSMVNQGFRDTGNTMAIGDGLNFASLKSAHKEIADVFGDKVAASLNDFEMSQVRELARREGVDIADAAIMREEGIAEALSPASTEAELYAQTRKQLYGAKKGNTDSISVLKQTTRAINDFTSNIDEFMNGKREQYLRKHSYMSSYDEALKRGFSNKQAREYATFAMNNATTNFGRSLYHLENLAKSVPYFRSAINGTKSFWRMLALDPMAISARVMGGLILPTWMLVGQSLGDPENRKVYVNTPEYMKENRLFFVIGGKAVSIPIPQELDSVVSPARHFIEYLYGAQPNQFWEVMANDALGFSPVNLDGFSLMDWNYLEGNPTILDRLNSGVSGIISSCAPIPFKATYMSLTGRDPYTGKPLRDKTYSYFDHESGMMVTSTNSQSDMATQLNEWFPGLSAKLANGILSSIFGQTGMDVLDSVVAATKGNGWVGDTFAEKQINRAGSKIFPNTSYTILDSNFRDAVQELEIKKDAIMNDPNVKSINQTLRTTTDENKRAALLAQRQDYVDSFNSEVKSLVDNMKEHYGVGLDRYQYASVLQLLNFGTDENWFQDSGYAANEDRSNYQVGKEVAISTLYNMGFTGTDDFSIFGYTKRNQDGEEYIVYNTPTGILDAQNSIYNRSSMNQSTISNSLEKTFKQKYGTIGNAMQKEYWNKYNKLKSNDYDGKDKLAKNWNNKVWSALAPTLTGMTVDDVVNNSDIINYLEKYIRVPSEYQKVKGRYVSSGYDAKTGTTQVDKNAAFIKSYVREMMKAMKGEK